MAMRCWMSLGTSYIPQLLIFNCENEVAKAEETSILIFENVCGLFFSEAQRTCKFCYSPCYIPEKKLYQKLDKNKQGKGKSRSPLLCLEPRSHYTISIKALFARKCNTGKTFWESCRSLVCPILVRICGIGTHKYLSSLCLELFW